MKRLLLFLTISLILFNVNNAVNQAGILSDIKYHPYQYLLPEDCDLWVYDTSFWMIWQLYPYDEFTATRLADFPCDHDWAYSDIMPYDENDSYCQEDLQSCHGLDVHPAKVQYRVCSICARHEKRINIEKYTRIEKNHQRK